MNFNTDFFARQHYNSATLICNVWQWPFGCPMLVLCRNAVVRVVQRFLRSGRSIILVYLSLTGVTKFDGTSKNTCRKIYVFRLKSPLIS